MSVRLMALVFSCNMPELKTDDGKTVPDTTAKFVLLSLADNANDEGEGCYPGVDTICKKTNYSTATVCNALNALRHNGFTKLEGKSKYDTNNYTVLAAKIEEFQWLKRSDFSGYNPPTLAAKTNPSVKPPVKPTSDNLFTTYQDEIGTLTQGISISLIALADQYTEAWVIDGIKICSERNKRSLGYLKGILQKWHVDGRGDTRSAKVDPASLPVKMPDETGKVYIRPQDRKPRVLA